MAERTFADCSVNEIYEWYIRLVEAMKNRLGSGSLATQMLEYYLSPNMQSQQGDFIIHNKFLTKLKNRNEVIERLRDQFRPVF